MCHYKKFCRRRDNRRPLFFLLFNWLYVYSLIVVSSYGLFCTVDQTLLKEPWAFSRECGHRWTSLSCKQRNKGNKHLFLSNKIREYLLPNSQSIDTRMLDKERDSMGSEKKRGITSSPLLWTREVYSVMTAFFSSLFLIQASDCLVSSGKLCSSLKEVRGNELNVFSLRRRRRK